MSVKMNSREHVCFWLDIDRMRCKDDSYLHCTER